MITLARRTNNTMRMKSISMISSLPKMTVRLRSFQRFFSTNTSLAVKSTQHIGNGSTSSIGRTSTMRRLMMKNYQWKKEGRYRSMLWFFLKAVRIPILLMGVYGVGNSQGTIDYSREPDVMKKRIFLNLLKVLGYDEDHEHVEKLDSSRVIIMKESDLKNHISNEPANIDRKIMNGTKFISRNSPKQSTNAVHFQNPILGAETEKYRTMQLKEVGLIGQQMIKAAQAHARQALKFRYKIFGGDSFIPYFGMRQVDDLEDEELIHWKEANERLGVESGAQWTFVLVDVHFPKALISEFLPNTIFVTTGLLDKYISNQHELALVIGQELAKLTMGNSYDMTSAIKNLNIVEVVLLSLDPTEGFLSVAFIAAIAWLKQYILSGFEEYDDDSLALMLVARACFDTKRAPDYLRNLHEATSSEISSSHSDNLSGGEGGGGGDFTIIKRYKPLEDYHDEKSILATNESFLDRYKRLEEQSESENAEKYINSSCRHLRGSFLSSWTNASS
eukprot:CAMPEP_0194091984 /NCGR_PEP_ID=MMETSP0149-20130528/45231_1 /TAXON_ID=122233 /ORGANISM="Chaetoceros debilis, Strain MM31A-1" /LENGTH=502 /DNA_ID=CAMNT_0038776777 /DNA_START=287 /DNA_END=1795 /DNA_ORIENTATION=-